MTPSSYSSRSRYDFLTSGSVDVFEPLVQALVRQLVQVVVEADLFRRGKIGKVILAEFDFEIAAVGDFQVSAPPRPGSSRTPDHLFGGFQIELIGFHLEPILFIDRLAGLHAEQHIVRMKIVALAVVAVVGRDHGNRNFLRQLDEQAIYLFLLRQLVVLDFDVIPVAENRRVLLYGGFGLLIIAVVQCL